MADYIKREDAIMWNPASKDNREYGTFNLDDAYETGYEDKIKQIEKIPAADVRENVRGHWTNVQIYVTGSSMADCSICGVTVHDSFMGNAAPNFCPNCGADMCGGEKDD